MNSYKFKYKKGWFYKTIQASGHKYYQDLNRMDIFHIDGSITSIGEWDKCDLKLGQDWLLFTKKDMEKQSGQKIDLTIGT
jgi:hypothetical protein